MKAMIDNERMKDERKNDLQQYLYPVTIKKIYLTRKHPCMLQGCLRNTNNLRTFPVSLAVQMQHDIRFPNGF